MKEQLQIQIKKFVYKYFSINFRNFSYNSSYFSAFAWSVNDKDELHTQMNAAFFAGFVTVEQGFVDGNKIKFKLHDIGRISFSRDLPVHDVVREWILLDASTLQARLDMETLTHGMQEHTFIRYKKIYP
uniref:THAP4_heme-bd domain-containing protein n=2 Tax=Ascaris lumbricoides TaxID=6252 RepID=A0A0M3IID2_ASCLU